VTVQWYTPLVALLHKAPVMTLTWSTMTVPVNGATFRPDHLVLLLAECLAVPHAVTDVNDSTDMRLQSLCSRRR